MDTDERLDVNDIRQAAIVMATHHLDEVPTSATHGALLRDGSLIAAGPLEDVLTPDRLERCFGLRLRVERAGGRWTAAAR